MKPIIKVENLSKQYRLGARQARYQTLRESLTKAVRSPLGWFNRNGSAEECTLWALKDVSFTVQPGEVVGIIGRNGAGKSTLLKILSRITEPTAGEVDLYGRVSSLLEVGTGFHPELTGRENIYLNGAILGMRRGEIERKLDEIIAFAEIEKFVDTPVKHYSSGMYTRLAFAVAAHLEPDVLLIDEVLAVGDASFQKKCLGKMGAVAREGRTVLFVSHNMTALKALCQRAVWLKDGVAVDEGDAATIVAQYLREADDSVLEQTWDDPTTAPGNDQVRLRRVRISSQMGNTAKDITVRTPVDVEVEYWNYVPDVHLNLSLVLYDLEGTCVLNTVSPSKRTDVGLARAVCHIPGGFLNDTSYRLRLLIVKDTSLPLLDRENAGMFEVHDVAREGNWHGKWMGVVRPTFEWTTQPAAPFARDGKQRAHAAGRREEI